jgi:hypothetical protein
MPQPLNNQSFNAKSVMDAKEQEASVRGAASSALKSPSEE